MKKFIILLFFISLILCFTKQEPDILIPDSAIRFRIIANSNTLEDQNKKLQIKNKIETKIYDLIKNSTTTNDVRTTLNNNLDNIKSIIEDFNINYDISYGYNYFPSKNYKGIIYNAGNYESLVITLGEGLGNNFWCVLFPPLCLLDNEISDTSDIDYQFYVKKLLNKF